jgi:hypothetical protein
VVRTRLALAVPLALLAVSACSSSGDDGTQTLDSTPSPGASAVTTTAPASEATTAPPVTGGQPSGAASAGTTTQAPAATTGSTAAVPPLSTKAPGTTAPSKATRAGVYTYTSSGTVTVGATPQDASGTQTLTVGPLRNGIQHSTLHSDDTGDTEQDIVVRDAGSYGASLKITTPAFVKEFRPDPAVLVMPDPAVIGKAWSWSATSTDGATKAKADNKLVRKETLTIGGLQVETVVLQTHLVLSGDFSYDAQVTLNWAPAYRLPVKQRTVGTGMFGAFTVKSDVTAVMKSVQPE